MNDIIRQLIVLIINIIIIKDPANCEKVAELLGIDCEWMITYFCKPKLKVGLNFNSIV